MDSDLGIQSLKLFTTLFTNSCNDLADYIIEVLGDHKHFFKSVTSTTPQGSVVHLSLGRTDFRQILSSKAKPCNGNDK